MDAVVAESQSLLDEFGPTSIGFYSRRSPQIPIAPGRLGLFAATVRATLELDHLARFRPPVLVVTRVVDRRGC